MIVVEYFLNAKVRLYGKQMRIHHHDCGC